MIRQGGETWRGRRSLAWLAVFFMLTMLLFTAGHGVYHLHEQAPCAGCPVCNRLVELLLGVGFALLAGVLPLSSLYRARCSRGRYGQVVWPFLVGATLVAHKVKLTN